MCETCGGSGFLHCVAHVAGDGCDNMMIRCPDCNRIIQRQKFIDREAITVERAIAFQESQLKLLRWLESEYPNA